MPSERGGEETPRSGPGSALVLVAFCALTMAVGAWPGLEPRLAAISIAAGVLVAMTGLLAVVWPGRARRGAFFALAVAQVLAAVLLATGIPPAPAASAWGTTARLALLWLLPLPFVLALARRLARLEEDDA